MSSAPAKTRTYVTLEEANAMLPELTNTIFRLQQIEIQARYLTRDLIKTGVSMLAEIALNDVTAASNTSGKTLSIDDLTTLQMLLKELSQSIKALEARGCYIKDLAQGIVDWNAKLGGRDIQLNWQLGEKAVGYWHDGNHAERKAIDLITTTHS